MKRSLHQAALAVAAAGIIGMIGCGSPQNDSSGSQEAPKATTAPPASSQDANPSAPAPSRPTQLASADKPGLYNADGKPHALHADNPVTGKTLKVTDYGANPSDNDQDDTGAINAAIKAAKRGDEVLLPNGVYNLNSTLSTDRSTHIELKSGVNLRGESKEGVVLVSSFDGKSGTNTRVMKALAQEGIVISNLTVSSTFKGKYPTDTTKNNPERGGPVTGIYIEDAANKGSYNITVDNVILEKYQRIGVRVSRSSDVIIRNSLFRNATDLGGGGAGYGVVFQGTPKADRKGQENDSLFNVVENSRFEGPYIRHGVLIQYYSHHNAVRNNVFSGTALDAIDLHGEMEYLNEVYNNTIENIARGGGVGLGNTGGTAPTNHSASGPNNYIHDNVISGSRNGITVTMGSPKSIIENNTIKGSKIKNGTGITVMNGPDTVLRGNKIIDNTGDSFWGIVLQHDPGDRNAGSIGEGDPVRVQIVGNTVTGNTGGVKITHGSDITMKDNIVQNNKEADQIASSALAK